MASKTFAEKMFGKACGNPGVSAGDAVYPDPELVIIHDGYLSAAHKELKELGYRRIAHPERVIAVTDHEVVYSNAAAVIRGQMNRKAVEAWPGSRLYDAGQGGHGHVFPMETGLVQAGMFLIAYDGHCSNFGAIGAYAMGTNTDITVVLATGTRLSVVPETIVVTLAGRLQPGVQGRDVGFRLSRDLMSERYGFSAETAVVEFQGAAADQMPVATRVGVINTLTEIYAGNVLFPPMTYEGVPIAEFGHLPSDAAAQFRGRIDIDLCDAEPTIALPGSPDNAADVSVAAGVRVDHAFIGACGSSQYDDLKSAAELLRGRRIAPGVRLFIVPGSVGIARRLMNEGLAQVFVDAGAFVLPSGCGPCAGGAIGPVGPGEISISTAATNTRGRMGAMDAEYYLGSPLTVAASAIRGQITDPREVMA